MQYTRPMIELVFEIRHRVSADLKPSIKLANPELLDELVEYHGTSRDVICNTLIKELLQLAGPPWDGWLEAEERAKTPRQVTKVYRGQVSLAEAPPEAQKKEDATKPKRIYRGQVLD